MLINSAELKKDTILFEKQSFSIFSISNRVCCTQVRFQNFVTASPNECMEEMYISFQSPFMGTNEPNKYQSNWLHSSVGKALHRHRRGEGFESC